MVASLSDGCIFLEVPSQPVSRSPRVCWGGKADTGRRTPRGARYFPLRGGSSRLSRAPDMMASANRQGARRTKRQDCLKALQQNEGLCSSALIVFTPHEGWEQWGIHPPLNAPGVPTQGDRLHTGTVRYRRTTLSLSLLFTLLPTVLAHSTALTVGSPTGLAAPRGPARSTLRYHTLPQHPFPNLYPIRY